MAITNSRVGVQVTTYNPDLINIFDSVIGDHTRVACFTEIGGATIGDACLIGAYVRISPQTIIGNNVIIGSNTVILKNVEIEDDVVIEACCVILPAVKIGKGAKLMCGARVVADVAPGEVVMGYGEKRAMSLEDAHYMPPLDSSPVLEFDPEKAWEEPPWQRVYRELGVPEINYTKFKSLVKADEDFFISRTKACKGEPFGEPKSTDEIGLGIGKE